MSLLTVIFSLFLLIYSIMAITMISSSYFVPVLVLISDDLQLPAHIAGATLLALASSTPELIDNFLTIFISGGDIATGETQI